MSAWLWTVPRSSAGREQATAVLGLPPPPPPAQQPRCQNTHQDRCTAVASCMCLMSDRILIGERHLFHLAGVLVCCCHLTATLRRPPPQQLLETVGSAYLAPS